MEMKHRHYKWYIISSGAGNLTKQRRYNNKSSRYLVIREISPSATLQSK